MNIFRFIFKIILLLAVLGALYYIFSGGLAEWGRKRPAPDNDGVNLSDRGRAEKPRRHGLSPEGRVKPDIHGKVVSIIIDDIGFNLSHLREIMGIDAPIAFAVLPLAPYSLEAADLLHKNGREVMLHLPMEPQDREKDPGPGALYLDLEESAIRRIMDKDFASVPHAVGVNNHMGSAFMENADKLAVVFEEIKRRNLFFIDSLTTSKSKARDLAGRMGIPFAGRNVFIDNEQDHDATVKELLNHLGKNKGGPLLMIGHPYPSTIAALKDAVPLLKSRGAVIVPLSKLFAEGLRAGVKN